MFTSRSGLLPTHSNAAHSPQPLKNSSRTDPFHSLFERIMGPALDRARARMEQEPPIEAPKNPTPTQSATFKWLGFGMIFNSIAGATVSTLGLAVGGSYLLHEASRGFLIVAATLFTLNVITSIQQSVKRSKKLKEEFIPDARELGRVKQVTKALSDQHSLTPPKITATNRVQSMGLFDQFGKVNELFFNPELTRRLTTRELSGIVAHELSHGDRFFNFFSVASRLLSGVAVSAVTWSTLHIAYNSMTQNGWSAWIAAGCALLASIGSGIAFGTGTGLIRNTAERANELRTDIRAVEMTQDLNGFISGLKKAYGFIYEDAHSAAKALQGIMKHPPIEKRVSWIKKACGNK